MNIHRVVTQLHTTDLEASIRFYVDRLGMRLLFRHRDFYAGIAVNDESDAARIHLKQVASADPSIDDVAANDHFHLYLEVADAAACAKALTERGVTLTRDVHDTPWQTREFVLRDDQGHTLYFGQSRA